MRYKIETLLLKKDYYLYRNWYKFHKVMSYETMSKFDFPTLRILKNCVSNATFEPGNRVSEASFDFFNLLVLESTEEFTVEYLCNKYEITRERLRQYIAKFVRENYETNRVR